MDYYIHYSMHNWAIKERINFSTVLLYIRATNWLYLLNVCKLLGLSDVYILISTDHCFYSCIFCSSSNCLTLTLFVLYHRCPVRLEKIALLGRCRQTASQQWIGGCSGLQKTLRGGAVIARMRMMTPQLEMIQPIICYLIGVLWDWLDFCKVLVRWDSLAPQNGSPE